MSDPRLLGQKADRTTGMRSQVATPAGSVSTDVVQLTWSS